FIFRATQSVELFCAYFQGTSDFSKDLSFVLFALFFIIIIVYILISFKIYCILKAQHREVFPSLCWAF
ncbi:hypothetical protein DWZ50_15730, partial [Mediterraneibacter gnavus]